MQIKPIRLNYFNALTHFFLNHIKISAINLYSNIHNANNGLKSPVRGAILVKKRQNTPY